MGNKRLYKFVRVIYVFLLKIIFRPKFIGTQNIPKEGAVIFAGNHVHAADPIMVMSATKRIIHYMAKEELFKGLHGWLFTKIGLIKVHRDKGNQLAVIEAEKVLAMGECVGIFPEGTRNKTNQELLKFRHGAVAIASKTKSLIVPFAIKGEYKIFRKGAVIEFGKPINIEELEIEEANDNLRNEVLKLLRKEEGTPVSVP